MKVYELTIYYRDGTKESTYVDGFEIKDNCLITYTKYATKNKGSRYIPLDNIKEWIAK